MDAELIPSLGELQDFYSSKTPSPTPDLFKNSKQMDLHSNVSSFHSDFEARDRSQAHTPISSPWHAPSSFQDPENLLLPDLESYKKQTHGKSGHENCTRVEQRLAGDVDKRAADREYERKFSCKFQERAESEIVLDDAEPDWISVLDQGLDTLTAVLIVDSGCRFKSCHRTGRTRPLPKGQRTCQLG
jgi:hypothetical protein